MRIEFEKIASAEGSKLIYQGVLGAMDIPQHPDFGKRPIKILDLGGGNGIIGSLLKQQLEELRGPLSDSELDSLVDYVNVDTDRRELDKSPGRTFDKDIDDIYSELENEPPFDFVLSINPRPRMLRYPDETLRYTSWDFQCQLGYAQDCITGGMQRIVLATASLVLKDGGKFLFSGFTGDEDVVEGTAQYAKEPALGLFLEKNTSLDIDEETKELFAIFDTKLNPDDRSIKRVINEFGEYRQFVLRREGKIDKEAIKKLLSKEIALCDQAYEELAHIDRFGTW